MGDEIREPRPSSQYISWCKSVLWHLFLSLLEAGNVVCSPQGQSWVMKKEKWKTEDTAMLKSPQQAGIPCSSLRGPMRFQLWCGQGKMGTEDISLPGHKPPPTFLGNAEVHWNVALLALNAPRITSKEPNSCTELSFQNASGNKGYGKILLD